jgi:hypothetical protein
METSFYLTPELKKRMVDLTFRSEDGQYHQWANQMPIIEQDPHKGTQWQEPAFPGTKKIF